MRSVLVFMVLFLFVTLLPAQADFKFVGKIPAPEPDSACTRVTGLAAGDGNLFATVRCDTSSFIYLLDPSDGAVIREKELDGSPPDCPDDSVRLISAAYEGFGHYWIGDQCGDLVNVIWVFDSLAVYKSFIPDTIETPSGLCYESGELFAVDYDLGRLATFDLSGNLLAADSLPDIASPTALSLYRDHFFLASETNDSLIFEITKQAAIIDTHFVEGLAGTFPLSATFFNGQLYVGSALDSILIFQPTTYNTYVPPGDSVTVEVVPEKMHITFDSVVESCWVRVEVSDGQACPTPDSVQFFSDVYDITTCTVFDYVAHIVLEDTTAIPGDPADVRMFSRPAGACQAFRDITVDSVEIIPILRTVARTKSEDDEFSIFAAGVDSRDVVDVIDLKFDYTRDAIVSNQDSIPFLAYTLITGLLDDAESMFYGGYTQAAAVLVDSIAKVVRDTTDIPHTYYPGETGHNVAGLIMSSAHTLSFSLTSYGTTHGITGDLDGGGPRLVLRPNPSNTSFAIEFECGGFQPVSVAVYSVRGRLVKRLLADKVPRGRVALTWEGDNEEGHAVASGAYFLVLKQGSDLTARKVILQR